MSDLHVDRELSLRFERAEGMVGASFVDARKATGVAAEWRDFGGALAIFDGVDSPLSQTFALGLANPITADALVEIEEFFTARGAPVMHEVSPLAGIDTTALLVAQGYRPIDLSTVLVQRIGERVVPASPLTARRTEPRDREAWIDASVAGWAEDPTFAAIIRSLSEVGMGNRSMAHYLVERAPGTAPIATASMGVADGVALLAGASTIPAARGEGAQSLLLSTRLADAHHRGCQFALMITAVGSASQRNAQRNGFQVVYTRTKWQRG